MRPNRSNFDSETSHLRDCEAQKKKSISTILQPFLSNVSLREKACLVHCPSHVIVVTKFGHKVKLASNPGALPGSLDLD